MNLRLTEDSSYRSTSELVANKMTRIVTQLDKLHTDNTISSRIIFGKQEYFFKQKVFCLLTVSVLGEGPLLCALCEESSSVFHGIKGFGEFSLLESKVLTTFPPSLV